MKFFGNVNKTEADLDATDKLVQSDCEKAGVKSAMRDGKVISLSEATVAEKYTALRAAQPTGDDLESRAQLVQRNGIIAADLEATSNKLTAAQATISSLTQENGKVKSQLEAAQAGVDTLTKEKSEQINLRDAAVRENTNLAREVTTHKLSLARQCVKHGALELKGSDGKALTADCSDEVIMAATKELSFQSLLDADGGAVNQAFTRLGINVAQLPGQSATPRAGNIAGQGLLAQLNAIEDPKERTLFFRKNREAIRNASTLRN